MAWLSFWYQYLIGGLVFLLGLLMVVRQGEAGFSSRRARKNLLILVGGMLLIFGIHLGLMLAGTA